LQHKYSLKNNINLSKQTLRGTQLFMSPILFDALKLRKKKYIRFVKHNIFKSDVYSFGLMSIYVASLGYESLYEIRELNNNNDIKSVLDKYLKSNYSDFFISLILKMVNVDEEKRCDFIQLEQIFQDII
jgi:serine/threonine protein kinase